MTRKCFSLFLSICLIATLFVFSSFPVSAEESLSLNNDSSVTLEQANQVLQSSSNFFTENKGQWPEEILFMGDTDFGKVAFTQEAIYYQLVKTSQSTKDFMVPNGNEVHEEKPIEDLSQGITEPWSDIDRFDEFALPPVIETQTIKLSFVNAQKPTIQGTALLPHYNNYFIGNDPDRWGIHCNNYTQVNYTNVWDNIDLSYFFTPQGMKYEYYVHPGADIQDVQVQVVGADLLSNEQSLELCTLLGNLKDDQLYVYGQDSLSTLEASFQIQNDIFSFDVDDVVRRDEAIVIDPLVYSTYLGGTEEENLWECTTDIYDNIYVTGWTFSANYPTLNPYDVSFSGNSDIFLTKIDVNTNTLIYSTYIGGLGFDETYAICIDEFENVLIGGRAKSSDFPIFPSDNTPGYCKTHFGGEGDAFLIKLNSTGSSFLFSTFMGGGVDDAISDIILDSSNNVYVCGSSTSSNFPINPSDGIVGAYKSYRGSRDGFVIKLNQDGSQFLYSSYISGSNWEYCDSIICDNDAFVYVGGGTYSVDFPTSTDAYQNVNKGGLDLYIVKLDTTNTDVVYSTLLGGDSWDYLGTGRNNLAIDLNDCIYLVGETSSSQNQGFSIGGSIPGYDTTYNGSGDGFIIRLNPNGSQILYSTYIGGEGRDSIAGIFLDPVGNIYIAGETTSTESTFPVGGTIETYDASYNGNTDTFFMKLNQDGSNVLFSTYIGGIGTDIGKSLALDSKSDAYIAGNTNSLESSFPIGNSVQGYDQTHNGVYDAFIVKLDLPKPILDITLSADDLFYQEGDLPILTVELCNVGDEYAHSCEVLVTLPPQLQFLDDQLIASTPVPNNSRLFQAGGIPAGGSIAFPVFTEVIENVPADTDVTVYFDATCEENAEDSTSLPIHLIHVVPPPPCPSLFLETTPNKPNYYYGDLVYLNVTLRNLGGQATGVKLELDLPPALSYAGCDNYRAVGQGQHQTFTIGTMEPDSTLRFVIYAEVITDVKVVQSIPILLELTANECDSFARRLINIKLEPKRTGQQNLDLSVKLLNLEFDEETGKYYLPYDQTLELQLQVSGYETYYNYTIHWGDGETTTLKNETSATILLKHKFTAKGSMNIKITVQDINGREKTSTLYLTIK